MPKRLIRTLTQVAFLMALEIVLTRFFAIPTPIVRISLGFLPLAVIGMLHGPVWAGLAATLADLIGVFMFPSPTGSTFFPGFTLTALLVGVTYGALLHRKQDWKRIVIAVLIVSFPLHLGLNTYWLTILLHKGYLALLPARITQCLFMIPVQVFLIRAASTKLHLLPGVELANS